MHYIQARAGIAPCLVPTAPLEGKAGNPCACRTEGSRVLPLHLGTVRGHTGQLESVPPGPQGTEQEVPRRWLRTQYSKNFPRKGGVGCSGEQGL